MADNYDDYTRDQLLRLLRERDRKPKFGLVWERDEIEHDNAVNQDFVALDFIPELSCPSDLSAQVSVPPFSKGGLEGILRADDAQPESTIPLDPLASSPPLSKGEAINSSTLPQQTFRNLIIEGDNFDALRFLRMTHAGKVKCIYIDPPYNTGNRDFIYNDRFIDKDDVYKHSKWLEFMYRRLLVAKELLAEDGVIFVSIDDNEVFNLGGLMNKVFGEKNFIANVIWQKIDSPKNTAQHFSDDHEYIICFAINKNVWRPNRLPRTEEMNARYKNPDNDPRGAWLLGDLAARNPYSLGLYSIKTPSGRVIDGPPAGSYWRISETKFHQLDADNRIWWGSSGSNRPGIKRFLSEVREGIVPQTLWQWSAVGSTRHSKQELSDILAAGTGYELFVTPKPVSLIERILRIATKPDDLVLDFFAGSGTTAHAVMKLNKEDGGNRRFILVSSTEAVEEKIPPNPPFSKGGTIAENPLNTDYSEGGTVDALEGDHDFPHILKNEEATPVLEDTSASSLPPFKKGGLGGFQDKNLCRDVCAERVRRVMRGYTNKKGEAADGLGGDFAYLRTRRIPAEAVLSRIEHEQVWTALQLIHTETLQPYVTVSDMQTAVLPDDGKLAYCTKVNEDILAQLLDLAGGNGIVVVYSWQPGWLRQYLPNESITVEAIPAFLINRFGGDYAA